jgi:sec-independent protein translocase protein TatA
MHPVLGEIVGWEALLVLLIIAILFGSSKLPHLARSIGEAAHEFRKGLSDEHVDPAPQKDAEDGEQRPDVGA